MYLNEITFNPGREGLTIDRFEALKPSLELLRESGEIHVESRHSSLSLELHLPHRGINGMPLTQNELAKRGFAYPLTFSNLSKIAFTREKVILHPIQIDGVKVGRKRTLRYRSGWICTSRIFFQRFRIVELDTCELRNQQLNAL